MTVAPVAVIALKIENAVLNFRTLLGNFILKKLLPVNTLIDFKTFVPSLTLFSYIPVKALCSIITGASNSYYTNALSVKR